MYIKTTEHGIINLDHYPRVAVSYDQKSYLLCVFTEKNPSNPKNPKITIAKYNERVDADYALAELYCVLGTGGSTWDPGSAPLVSDIWYMVKLNHQRDTEIRALTKDVILKVTGTGNIIIEYSSEYDNRWDKDALETKQQIVGDDLVESLRNSKIFKDEKIPSPIQHCFWKSSDEIQTN